MIAARAEDIEHTDAAAACLAELRKRTGRRHGTMERHCLRQIQIARALAGDRPYDDELLLCAGWLHDAGLWVPGRDPYVTEGARLADEVLGPFDWPPARRRILHDAIEQHHALRSREELGLEVELIRRSDLVDVSAGRVSFGLDRVWLRELNRTVPRAGFARLLAWAAVHEVRRSPAGALRIFAPRRTAPTTFYG
jgi:HD domain